MSSNKLTGYRGNARTKIEKTKEGLDLAHKLMTRLEDQARDNRFSPTELQIRIETIRLTVKQCMITLDRLAVDNWEMAGLEKP